MHRSQATPRQDLDTITAFLGATGGTLLVIGSAVGWRSLGSADTLLDKGGTYTIALGTLGCILAVLLFVRAGGLRRWQAGIGFLVLAMLTSGLFILVGRSGCEDCSTLGFGVGVFVFGLPSAAFVGAFVVGLLGRRPERQTLDRVGAILGAIGGALLMIGSQLPWRDGDGRPRGPGVFISWAGVGFAGKIMLAVGFVGGVAGLWLLLRSATAQRGTVGLAFLAVGSVALVISFVDDRRASPAIEVFSRRVGQAGAMAFLAACIALAVGWRTQAADERRMSSRRLTPSPTD